MAVLAWIMVIAQVAIQVADRSGKLSQARSQQLKDLDRVWILMETDLRNVVAHAREVPFSEPIPAMVIAQAEEYQLAFIRVGQANPLLLPRSEVLRVGYRLEDDILWRDSWIDPYNPVEETARPQQLLDGVESFEVLALPRAPAGRSVTEGPWLEEWPSGIGSSAASLPLALEITLEIKDRGELKRLITLPPGGSGSQGRGTN